MATMPNVVGEEYQEAINAIVSAGVAVPDRWSIFATTTIAITWIPSAMPSGTVIAQSPASGDSVEPNSPVTLTVSDFPIGVVYP